MEVKQLEGFVLLIVMLGLIIGVGVLVLDKFGEAVKDSTVIQDENVTTTAGAGTAANDDITSLEGCFDSNNKTVFTVGTACNSTSTGILINRTAGSTIMQLNYTYDKDSTATTTVTSVNSSMSTIASTWMPLIVTIIVLSIILTLVIRSFVTKR